MWKRNSIVLCTLALTIMSVFVGAGTYAYYSGEPFIIDFSSPETIEPVISGLSPGETVYIVIKIPNRYGRAVTAWISLKNVVCSENGVVEPEQEWYDLYSVRNDIDEAITFGLWIDRDGDTSTCSERDVLVIGEEEGLYVADVVDAIPLGKIPARSSIILVSSYHMDEETENWAQSDTMTFDIERVLEVPSAPSVTGMSLPPPLPPNMVVEEVPADQTGYVVDASDLTGTTVTLDTVAKVTVTIIKYEENPYPEDPIPATALPTYVDVEVSDPDAVIWPIYVEMSYTDEEIEGLEESSLGIYYWMDGAWQRCSDTGVDTERNVVWAYMTAEEASGSPILIGGITSLEPAEFVVSYLKIEPRRIELGDMVTISVNVTNVGETPGSYNVTLNIEDIISVKEVTLQGGKSEIVEFEFVPEAEGTYDVDIEGMIGHIYVIITIPVPPLPPYLSNLTVTPTEIEIGDNVTISLDIRNMDSQSIDYIVTMQYEIHIPWNAWTELVDVELEAYESKTVSRTIIPDTVGEYNVTVDGLTGSFTVKAPPKPAEFVVSGLEVDNDRVAAGEEVKITVEVENIGETEGIYTVLLEVDGLVTELAEVTLEGGESTTVTFTITEAAGDHTVGVEDMTVDFTVTALGISPGYVAGIIIVILAAAALLYAIWKGKLPTLSPEIDDEI